jgi:hypothetical protein
MSHFGAPNNAFSVPPTAHSSPKTTQSSDTSRQSQSGNAPGPQPRPPPGSQSEPTRSTVELLRAAGSPSCAPSPRRNLQKTRSLFSQLPRACLGKLIGFCANMALQKGVLSAPQRVSSSTPERIVALFCVAMNTSHSISWRLRSSSTRRWLPFEISSR